MYKDSMTTEEIRKHPYEILQVDKTDRNIWNRWYQEFADDEEATEHCKTLDDEDYIFIRRRVN